MPSLPQPRSKLWRHQRGALDHLYCDGSSHSGPHCPRPFIHPLWEMSEKARILHQRLSRHVQTLRQTQWRQHQKLPTDSAHKIANNEALRYLRIHFHVMSHCSRCVGGIPFVPLAKFAAGNLLFYNVVNVRNEKDEDKQDAHCCQINGNFFEKIFSQVTSQSFLFIFYVKFVIYRTLMLGLTVSEQTCWCYINLP